MKSQTLSTIIVTLILICMSTLIMRSKVKKILCFEYKGKIKCVQIIKLMK
jgi:hypothetical protein